MLLLGVLGLSLVMLYFWISAPKSLAVLGFLISNFAGLSAFGIGPWGRHFSSLVVREDEEYRATLITKQPWER